MPYKVVLVVYEKPEEADLLTGRLTMAGCEGFEVEDHLLKAYFPKPFSAQKLQQPLQGFSYQIQELPDQNWNALWESNYPPVMIDDFCSIRADFHPPLAPAKYELLIHPHSSFGTGHHATTRMMIGWMRGLEIRGQRVLDFGTGTGILAILAAKMGASAVTGLEIDPVALDNARDNIRKNDTPMVRLLPDTDQIPAQDRYGVILANINRNTLIDSAAWLSEHLAPGGRLVLSGFLGADTEAMTQAFRQVGRTPMGVLSEGSWQAWQLG